MKNLEYTRLKKFLKEKEDGDKFNPEYIESHPNWYLERSIREFFSSVARPIVGQTYNLTFCCTDQEYDIVKNLFTQQLLAQGILDREDQIHSKFISRKSEDILKKYPNVRHTAEFVLQIIPGEYTYEELQKRVERAYELARAPYVPKQESKQKYPYGPVHLYIY